jgi:hypothetical protein
MSMTVTIEIDPLFAGKPANYHFSDADFDQNDYLSGEQVLGMLAWHGIEFDADTLCAMARWPQFIPGPRWIGHNPLFQALAVVSWIEQLEYERANVRVRRDPQPRPLRF